MKSTIDMAREAGIELDLIDKDEGQIWYITTEGMKAFEALVRADEQARSAPYVASQLVQEPVAYVVTTEVHGQMCSFIHRIDLTKLLPDGAKLYTTPPAAQRPVPEERKWVGLTDEDIQEVRENCGITHHAIKTIEAKLREKNT